MFRKRSRFFTARTRSLATSPHYLYTVLDLYNIEKCTLATGAFPESNAISPSVAVDIQSMTPINHRRGRRHCCHYIILYGRARINICTHNARTHAGTGTRTPPVQQHISSAYRRDLNFKSPRPKKKKKNRDLIKFLSERVSGTCVHETCEMEAIYRLIIISVRRCRGKNRCREIYHKKYMSCL